jgi:ElaB/YqjD/DUF883 family membrane-anchored ribosome-binding protein
MVDRARRAEATTSVRVEEIQTRALELAATAREAFTGGTTSLRAYVIKQPARAIGLALGVGVLLGWLIKRR